MFGALQRGWLTPALSVTTAGHGKQAYNVHGRQTGRRGASAILQAITSGMRDLPCTPRPSARPKLIALQLMGKHSRGPGLCKLLYDTRVNRVHFPRRVGFPAARPSTSARGREREAGRTSQLPEHRAAIPADRSFMTGDQTSALWRRQPASINLGNSTLF